jgi:hypothetical protein
VALLDQVRRDRLLERVLVEGVLGVVMVVVTTVVHMVQAAEALLAPLIIQEEQANKALFVLYGQDQQDNSHQLVWEHKKTFLIEYFFIINKVYSL